MGRAVVYTSATLSLAALELLVHVRAEDAPDDLISVWADVPDDLIGQTLQPADLPDGWRSVTGNSTVVARGDAWLVGGESAAIAVPSVVIPEEQNILLNPEHPDFSRVVVGSARTFAFDTRLLA